MTFFGFSSGLSAGFLVPVWNMWLATQGFSSTTVGLLAWITVPYALKVFLSPFVDTVTFGKLTKLVGQRKSWVILMEIGFSSCLLLLSSIPPKEHILAISFLGVMACFCAALKDIVLEAYRIEIMPKQFQSAGAGANAFGFRLGIWISGCFIVLLACYTTWSFAFGVLSICSLSGLITVLMAPKKQFLSLGRISWSAYRYLLEDNLFFFKKNYAIYWVLALIFSYKMCNIFAKSMNSFFLLSIGHSPIQIATVEKGAGVAAVMLGTFLGGFLTQKTGVQRSIKIWTMLQCLVAMSFIAYSFLGKNIYLLVFNVILSESIHGAGGAINISYQSSLCTPGRASIQYAMLSSLGTFGRILSTSFAGVMADHLSWPLFFFFSLLVCVPTFFIANSPYPFLKK